MTPTKEGKKKTFKCQETDLLGSCDLRDDAYVYVFGLKMLKNFASKIFFFFLQ